MQFCRSAVALLVSAAALLVLFLCGPLLVSARAQASGTTLRIAAASDLQPVMPALAREYEQQTGVKLEVSFGSSSSLATQIINGAPFDVFLGADFSFPEKVVAKGLADGNAPTAYATGKLVLWARKDSPIQPLSMDLLADPRVTRIAMADPEHAPYGFAASQALIRLKLTDKVKSRLVTAENIAQTAQFVESGNAQIGFLSLTLSKSDHMQQVGTYVLVPFVYPKIRQCGVVVKSSPHLEQARGFLKWLVSPAVQDSLPRFGLDPAN